MAKDIYIHQTASDKRFYPAGIETYRPEEAKELVRVGSVELHESKLIMSLCLETLKTWDYNPEASIIFLLKLAEKARLSQAALLIEGTENSYATIDESEEMILTESSVNAQNYFWILKEFANEESSFFATAVLGDEGELCNVTFTEALLKLSDEERRAVITLGTSQLLRNKA